MWPSRNRWACSAPLGGPVVPGRVDDDRRVVGRAVDGRERIGGRGGDGVVVERPVHAPATDHDDRPEVRQPVADLGDLGPVGEVGDQRGGAGVGQPVFDRLGPEQHEQGDGDEAGPVGGEVGERGLGRLRQQDRDPFARGVTQPDEHVRQAVRRPADLLEREPLDGASLVLEDQREVVGPRRGVPVDRVDRDVVALGDVPAERVSQRLVRPAVGHAADDTGGPDRRPDRGPRRPDPNRNPVGRQRRRAGGILSADPNVPREPSQPRPRPSNRYLRWCP